MNKIIKINIKFRDIKILEQYGWQFIKYNGKIAPKYVSKSKKALSCVQFTKHACGINKIAIQTPDALYRFLQGK